jgi:hypothetical protein
MKKMISNKNPKVESKIIKDHINIQGTDIETIFHVKNWGEPFDRKLLKEKIKQAIEEAKIPVQDIKNIEARTSLIKYLGPDKESNLPLYAMDDNVLIVHLNNGERIQLNIEQRIKIL